MLFLLLSYDPSHTVGSMAKSLLLVKMFIFQQITWSLRRFDGLSLCQVVDRALLKKQFIFWKRKSYFSTFPKQFLEGPLTNFFLVF